MDIPLVAEVERVLLRGLGKLLNNLCRCCQDVLARASALLFGVLSSRDACLTHRLPMLMLMLQPRAAAITRLLQIALAGGLLGSPFLLCFHNEKWLQKLLQEK